MKSQNKVESLNKQGFGMCVALALEFILGMTTTIFVQFPQGASENELWQFAWKQIPLAIHIVLGLIIFVGSIVLAVRSAKSKHKQWITASFIGLLGIFGSISAGSTFVASQKDLYSYVMALGFIISLLSYTWGIFASRKMD